MPLFARFLPVIALAAALCAVDAQATALAQSTPSARDRERLDDLFDDLAEREREGRGGLRGAIDPDIEEGEERDSRAESGAENADGLLPLPDQPLLTGEETQRPVAAVEEEDPYAPIGVRMGSFLLFPELLVDTVYIGNVFLSERNPESDWALEFTPSLQVQSDWSRHSLAATIDGVRSYHERFTSEDDKTFNALVTGQLDIRSTTNLVAEANYSEFLEDRSSTDFPDNAAERPQGRTSGASLEGNHTFNRVTLTLRGALAQEDFDDSRLEDGTISNNDDRDYTEHRLTGRAAYEFRPGVSAFVEASMNDRVFDQRIEDGGTISGSDGHDIQGGLAFELTGKLTGEASVGYAIQTPDDPTLEEVDGLIFNAALEWEATGLTTVRFDAFSNVAETTIAGSAGSVQRAATLSIEHRPRRHIVLGASLGYERETFSGSDDVDEDWTMGLTGVYNLTRSAALTAGYEHAKSISSGPGGDYSTDKLRFGVRLRR